MNEIVKIGDRLPAANGIVRELMDAHTHPSTNGRPFENVKVRYANGYGLSVSRGGLAYCGENLFEVAAIQWAGDGPNDWEFCGKGVLGWGDDIRGWQSDEELQALEREVAAL